MQADIVVDLNQVSFGYDVNRPILKELNFQLRRGEKVGLIGYNGSGKTTFFQVLMGLARPVSGEMRILGRHITSDQDFVAVRQRVGLLFQDADDQLFCPTVLEDVTFGPLNLGKSPEQARAIAARVLDDLGLAGFENRVTHELSGGEKKLVSLATVLAMDPEILLLDEPTNGLDEATRETIIAVLSRPEFTSVVISHEFDFLGRLTNRIVSMRHGHLVEEDAEAIHSHYHVHRFGDYPHEHSP